MSMRCKLALALALGLAPGLAGCVDEAADLGQPPPVQLVTARRDLVVALHDDPQLQPAARNQLRKTVAELGGAQPGAVRARILAASAGDADAVRRALLGFGVDPAHIVAERVQDVRRLRPHVQLSRSFATEADCNAAITPARNGDIAPSLDGLQRCIEQNSLAAMLVDPADLVDPPDLAPADAAFQVGALNARLRQAQTSLPSAGSTPDSAPASGSYGSAAPVAVAAPVVPAPPSPP